MTGALEPAQQHLDFIIPPDAAGAQPAAKHTSGVETDIQTQLPVCIHSAGGVTEYADTEANRLPTGHSRSGLST